MIINDLYTAQRALSDDDYASWGAPAKPYKGKKGKGWYVVPASRDEVVVLF